jgi:beta-glucanase (GH16 family)
MRFGVIWGPESEDENEEDSGFRTAPADMAKGFHDYAVLWRDGWLTFMLDRRPYWATPQPADWGGEYMFIYLNVAIGGPDSFTGAGPDDTTPNPTDLLVDWVQVLGTDATDYVSA